MVRGLSTQDAERLRTFERRGHDAMAPAYYDFFSRVTALAIDPLLDAAGITEGQHILDVATGPGSLAAASLARGARPVGVDLSPGMLELARRLHPGIEFREADVEHLPFADGTFDAVVCSFGLGHFPLPEASLAECVRAVKPGGRVTFAWWAEPSRQRIQGLFREAVAEVGVALPAEVPAGHSSLRFCETAEFLRLLQGAGLAGVAIEQHATTFRVDSADALFQGGLSSMVLTGAAIRGHKNQPFKTPSAPLSFDARAPMSGLMDCMYRSRSRSVPAQNRIEPIGLAARRHQQGPVRCT